jgi:hypothetical protein
MPLTNFETSMVRPSRSRVTQTSNQDSSGRSSADSAHVINVTVIIMMSYIKYDVSRKQRKSDIPNSAKSSERTAIMRVIARGLDTAILSGGEGGIRTLGTGVSPYNGLAIHKEVLNRLENFLLYSSFQRLANQSI